jgi:LPXTG-site transpeptidase (sortase) family protein
MFAKLKIILKGIAFRSNLFWAGTAKTFFMQVFVFLFFFGMEKSLSLKQINFPVLLNSIIIIILFGLFSLVTALSLKEISTRSVANNVFVRSGIYSYIRHPFFASIVFLLNPLFAVLFKSWGMLVACVVCYFLWKDEAQEEEAKLKEKFGKEYFIYQAKTPKIFFPQIFELMYSKKRVVFYIVIVAISFVLVNFTFNTFVNISASRNTFEEEVVPQDALIPTTKITKPKTTPKPKIKYSRKIDDNAYRNGNLSIPSIGAKAPIIWVKKIKYVNYYHKYGVVRYPKTAVFGDGEGAILLSGHSSSPINVRGSYDRVFAKLNYLQPNDRIYVNYEGKKYVYKIYRKKIVWPSQVSFKEYKNQETLVLLSCWPVGTNARRILIEAKRIK